MSGAPIATAVARFSYHKSLAMFRDEDWDDEPVEHIPEEEPQSPEPTPPASEKIVKVQKFGMSVLPTASRRKSFLRVASNLRPTKLKSADTHKDNEKTDAVPSPLSIKAAVKKIEPTSTGPFFPLQELKTSTPEGIDPSRRELYLSDADFMEVFKMEKKMFGALAKWKRDMKKKDVGLGERIAPPPPSNVPPPPAPAPAPASTDDTLTSANTSESATAAAPPAITTDTAASDAVSDDVTEHVIDDDPAVTSSPTQTADDSPSGGTGKAMGSIRRRSIFNHLAHLAGGHKKPSIKEKESRRSFVSRKGSGAARRRSSIEGSHSVGGAGAAALPPAGGTGVRLKPGAAHVVTLQLLPTGYSTVGWLPANSFIVCL